MTTIDELETRLAELEARAGIGVTPLAANPPVTIGELTDVPAPGSPIASAWAQEVTNRIVHRFPTTAALNAWAAAPGSRAYVTADDRFYARVAGPPAAWVREGPTAIALINLTNSNQTLTTAPLDLCSPLPFTVVAGHIYSARCWAVLGNVSVAALATLTLTDAAGALIRQSQASCTVVGAYTSIMLEDVWTAGANATLQRKVRASLSAGSGAYVGGTSMNGVLIISDLGQGGVTP
jgi:hypothetical protein